MILKGQKIYGPNEQGYEVTRDIQFGDTINSSDFVSFGGAPEPQTGMLMPQWLATSLQARVVGGSLRVCGFD